MAKSLVIHRGNGWYELPNGKKVRGKKKALARLTTQQGTSGLSRMRFLQQAGFQYGTDRDVYTTAGYVQEGAETFDRYWGMYERDPVAGRIVDMPAKTTWKTPPEIIDGEPQEEGERNQTEFEAVWDALVDRLKIWRHLERVDRLGRIGRYAVLFIGVRGSEDTELKDEMPPLQGPEDILYLSAFSERYAAIQTWEKDPGSKRFGLPVQYKIDLSSGVQSFKTGSLLVHHSRVIHVAEDALLDDVFGRPALKRVLNALTDLLKVSASTGEAYWQLAARILQAKIDPNMEMDASDVTAMGESLEEVIHDLRRQFVGHGVDLDWLKGEIPEPQDAFEVYKALCAVGSGIPTRVLFGSEQGQLASAQDERNFFGLVNERQEQHAEPNILRPFIDKLVAAKGLPKHGADGYTVVWPTLFEESEKDTAEANKARAETAKALTPMGGDPRELVEVDEERSVWLIPSSQQQPRIPAPGDLLDGLEGEGGDAE
jgi:hypothetical protein